MPSRRQLAAYADPLLHGLLAAAVAAPLGRGPVLTAVAAGTLIDVDHPIAARSPRLVAMTSLATRPRSHSLLTALGAGAIGAAAGGALHGWAAFAGLASHLLRDAGDHAAPTPLLWPWSPPRQIGRARAAAGIAALALGSLAVSRLAARGAGPSGAPAAGVDGAAARPRTA
jgi:LexA-binding, inner membrane-associated putative hydrolase